MRTPRQRGNYLLAKRKIIDAMRRVAAARRLKKAWYAPPMRLYARGKFRKTGGGPGYRLAARRFKSKIRR